MFDVDIDDKNNNVKRTRKHSFRVFVWREDVGGFHSRICVGWSCVALAAVASVAAERSSDPVSWNAALSADNLRTLDIIYIRYSSLSNTHTQYLLFIKRNREKI